MSKDSVVIFKTWKEHQQDENAGAIFALIGLAAIDIYDSLQ